MLEMKQITKSYGDFYANDRVDLTVQSGEVHALLGENGAGKSTLMNILYGMSRPTSGEIWWNGKQLLLRSPKDAIAAGIGMVHQHFMLIPALSVIENVVLGLKDETGHLELRRAAEKFSQLAERFGMPIDPWARVEGLSVGEQQRVEILKALYRKAELLILDEPTAVLTPKESKLLFQTIRQLTQEGMTVIFISHKLPEIMEICDRCTILCRGKKVKTLAIADITDQQELANLMIGRKVELVLKKESCVPGKIVLQVDHLSYRDGEGVERVRNADFSLRAGEILGICGVDGSGQSELIHCITGLQHASTGSVFIEGQDCTQKGTREILQLGVSHIPEDRQKSAMVSGMSVVENMVLMEHRSARYLTHGLLDWKRAERYCGALCDKFQVMRRSMREPLERLSGGNQQKVIVARELDRAPKLFIAMHPNRGLDISSAKYIQQQLLLAKGRGVAVLLVSADLEEVMETSDRIAVMHGGKIMDILEQRDATPERLGSLMAGVAARKEKENDNG